MPEEIIVIIGKLASPEAIKAAMAFGALAQIADMLSALRKQQTNFQSHPVARESVSRMGMRLIEEQITLRTTLHTLLGRDNVPIP